MHRLRNRLRKLTQKELAPKLIGVDDPSPSLAQQPSQVPTPATVRTEPYGLFRLNPNEPSDESKNRVDVDIVAIHGLNGDAYSTWQHENGTLWLKDLLPSSLPGARIFTYGYPSELFWSKSVATLRDYSQYLLSALTAVSDGQQRPIIFVCHSLGGIVCKQALVLAHEDERLYGNILAATSSVVFFGTPHRGSRGADIGKTIASVVNTCLRISQTAVFTGSIRDDLLTTLGSHSQALSDLATSARNRLNSLEVVSFHETEKIPGLSELVVDRESAIMCVANEQITPLYANHRSMCRFQSATENGYSLVSNAMKRLARIALIKKEMAAKTNRTSSNQSLSEAEKSCMILLNSTFLAEYKAELPRPVRGTCSWILSQDEYRDWINTEETSLLWVTGEPGCGKTMLSAYLTEHLRLSRTTPVRPQVFFFFCDDKVKSQRDANAILRGILYQILQQHRRLIKHVKSRFEIDGPSLANSFSALWELFLKVVADSASGPVGVIVDAIDECETRTRKSFLNAIMHLVGEDKETHGQSQNCIKFLITSRPSLGNSYNLTGFLKSRKGRLRIEHDQSRVSEDVKLVIQSKVEEIATRFQCDDDTKRFLEQVLYSKSDQSFLWLTMVLHSLEGSSKASKRDFERIINAFPRNLEATYGEFLLRIPSQDREDAKKILGFLVGSSRQLTLTEMNIAFTIDQNHRSTAAVIVDLQKSISSTLELIIGPFARIKGSKQPSDEDSKISLIHLTAKEYLTDMALHSEDQIVQSLAVPPTDAALSISWACIQYLLLQDFTLDLFAMDRKSFETTSPTSPSSMDIDVGVWDGLFCTDEQLGLESIFKESQVFEEEKCLLIAQQSKFFDYAATHWAEHFSICEGIAPAFIQQAVRRLIACPGPFVANWLKYYWIKTNMEYPFPEKLDIIEVAAFHNFPILLSELLESGGPGEQATRDRALFWAARMCRPESLKVLLKHGANPNSKGLDRQTALTISAQYGHLGVVQTLLDEPRTEATLRAKSGRSALSFAAGNGHLDIVELLLNDGRCRPNEQDDVRWTPVFWAAEADYGEILQILLKQPTVDINQVDSTGRSAVSWAAGEGSRGALKVLLRHPGVDLNLKDSKGRSPLSWAAGNGRTEVVDILLKKRKVDKSSKDADHRNAISWACQGGHTATLRALLQYQCGGVDDLDIDSWTPLLWALFNQSPSTVETLLTSRLVDINRQDSYGRTALIWAAGYGYLDVVQLLVDYKADTMITNKDGNTAMDVARNGGYTEVSDFLEAAQQP